MINNLVFPFEGDSGLSKRELFAALALQGLLSNPNIVKSINPNSISTKYAEQIAIEAAIMADSLVDELEIE